MKPKGRPQKAKTVKNAPQVTKFSPRGKPGRPDEVDLDINGFEAIRLADYLSLKQVEAAKSMQISQQTFSRIIRKARRCLADAFINGKILRIKNE